MALMQVLMFIGHRQGYNNLQTLDNVLLNSANGAIAICHRLLEACWCMCVHMSISGKVVCLARAAGVAQKFTSLMK